MFDKIKQLTKDAVIYGISTILGRFLNFLLVPFYTNIFPPAEYGIVSNVYAIVALLNIIFIYGMDAAFLKFATKEELSKKKVFSTIFNVILITSVLFSILIIFFNHNINQFLGIPQKYDYIMLIMLGVIIFDALTVFPFTYLRITNQAIKFSVIRVINILINIILNLVLILIFHWGIEAVFISNLVASTFNFIILLPIIKNNYELNIDKILLKRIFKFGLPYLPGALAAILMQVIDRPIVEHLTDMHTLGIYQANYRLGIFMMLYVSMFQYAWQPFFLQNAKEENAKEIFSKVFTYFTLVGSFVLVILSLFIEDLMKIKISSVSFIGEAYWSGLNIVPIILLAYLFDGFYVNFTAGLYIREKSISVPFIMGIGAIANILFNFLLIPVWNITGAALATLISYFIIAVGFYIVSQRIYKINYEKNKLIKIFLSVFIIAFLYYEFMYLQRLDLIIKIILMGLFFILLFIFKIIKTSDLKIMLSLLKNRIK
ncbi:MAG: oligosaccharide flippase family protein [Ignavibacterium sp.]